METTCNGEHNTWRVEWKQPAIVNTWRVEWKQPAIVNTWRVEWKTVFFILLIHLVTTVYN